MYRVWCREDRTPDEEPGPLVLATSRMFPTRVEAEAYAATVNPQREPQVRPAHWGATGWE
jgi:hypothetical protein